MFYAKRLMRLLAEDGIALLPQKEIKIRTPTGSMVNGLTPEDDSVCMVSIMRSGDALLECMRECLPSARVGKILIQRDETADEKNAVLMYQKLPANISNSNVLLLDPMLATGGSALAAIEVLLKGGVLEEKIIFVNIISCPEGIKALFSTHPKIKIMTCAIDQGLNEQKYIVPGLGDYGDRFYATA